MRQSKNLLQLNQAKSKQTVVLKKLKGLTQITVKEDKHTAREDMLFSLVAIPVLQKLVRHRLNKLKGSQGDNFSMIAI